MLVVFGSINMDFVFPLQHLPQPGESVWSEASRAALGGKGANQAVAAARDGMAVRLVGAVGEDLLAHSARAALRAAGIEAEGVVERGGATGRSAILVDPAGYTMVATDHGANARARADQVDDGLLGPGTTLLLQMETDPAENAALIARARRRGTRIVLHLSPPRMIDTAALRAVDLLIGNSRECAWLGEHLGTGNNPASLHAALGVATVRMLGTQGAEAVDDDGYVQVDALAVDARDTTGAADCFTGVLAAALARGAGLATALRRAAVASALSAETVGVQDSFPFARDIDAGMRRAPEPTRTQPEVTD